jgi:hypothetical protein
VHRLPKDESGDHTHRTPHGLSGLSRQMVTWQLVTSLYVKYLNNRNEQRHKAGTVRGSNSCFVVVAMVFRLVLASPDVSSTSTVSSSVVYGVLQYGVW